MGIIIKTVYHINGLHKFISQ